MNETNTYKKLKDKPQNNFPVKIFIHHTGGTKLNPLADTSHHTAVIVEAGHLAKGWDGIGYTEFIEKDGKVWLGRPEHRNGAHVKEDGWNTKSIGICLAGNFDVTLPTEAQIKSLTERLKYHMQRFNIPVNKIEPHRLALGNPPYKSCYGEKLSDNWAKDLVSVSTIEMVSVPKSILKELLKYVS
jgi:N-acetylmuramoyl-L-alanine amidase